MFEKLFHKIILRGPEAIMAAAGWTELTTVLDRRIAYSEHCPIRKKNGILVVGAREFKKWLKVHPEAAQEIIRPLFEIIQHQKIMLKYGGEKELNRRVII